MSTFSELFQERPLPILLESDQGHPSNSLPSLDAPSPKTFWSHIGGNLSPPSAATSNAEARAIPAHKGSFQDPFQIFGRQVREFGQEIKRGFEAGAVAVVTHAAASAIRFNPDELEHLKQGNKEHLKDITGSDHLNALLLQAVPKVVELVTPEIAALESPVIVEYLKGQLQPGGLLFTLFEVLLPKIIINLAGPKVADEQPGNAPLLAIFPRLVALVSEHAADIEARIELELQGIDTTLSREQKGDLLRAGHLNRIREIFTPLSNSFLDQSLPNGMQDLPLVAPLDAILWSMLKNKVFPDLLFTLYWMLADFQLDRQQKELRRAPHGELLDNLADALPLAIDAFGLPLLEKCSPLIAEEILEEIVEADIEDRAGLKSWIQSLFEDLARQDCPTTKQLVAQIGLYAQSFFSHVMLNLTDTGTGDLPVVSQCSFHWEAFVAEQAHAINTRLGLLEQDSQTPIDDPELQRLFLPLCNKMLEGLKIKGSSDLPLPEYFKNMVYAQLQLKGSQGLISFYIELKARKAKEEEALHHLRSHYGAEFPQISAALDRFLEARLDALPNYSGVLSRIFFNAFSSQLLEWNPVHSDALPAYLQERLPTLKGLFEAELTQPTPAAKELILPFLRAEYLQLLAREIGGGMTEEELQNQINTRFDVIISVLTGVGACVSEMQLHLESEENTAQRIEAMHVPNFVAEHDKIEVRQTLREIANLKQSMANLLEVYERGGDIEAIRAPLMEAQQQKLAHERALNAIQKRSLQTLAAEAVALIDFDHVNAPPLFITAIKDIISQHLLPEILVNAYDIASDASNLNHMLLQSLKNLNTSEASDVAATAEAEEAPSPPDDALQHRLKEACSTLLTKMVDLSADRMHGFIINSPMVHAPLVNILAAALRQQLSQPLCKEILMLDMGSVNQFTNPSLEAQSTLATEQTAEQLIAALQSERNVEKELEDELVKLAIKGASDMPMYALSKGWKILFNKMENFLNNFGCLGSLVKHVINFIVQVIFLQIIGTVLAYIFKLIYDNGLMLAEPYLRGKIRNLLQALHMNVNRNIIHRAISDIVSQLGRVPQNG